MIKEASKDIQDPDLDKIDEIVKELRANFLDGRTQDLAFRRSMLQKVVQGCKEMEKEIAEGLYLDLKQDEATAYIVNTLMLKNEALDCISHLENW